MNQIEQALRQLTGEKAVIESFAVKDRLSLYLSASYKFYLAKLLDTEFLLAKPTEERKVLQIKVQFEKIKEALGYEIVLLTDQLTPYKKGRLIEERIAFICSNKQIFLPFMYLNLQNERTKAVYKTSDEFFTASMQLIFLSILYSDDTLITQDALSHKLGLSTMTVSRTLEKFVQLNLLDYSIGGKTGRQKIYYCNDKKAFYQIGKAYLINPILERFFVRKVPENVKKYAGGLSALSERTLLAQPAYPVVAVSRQDRSDLSHYLAPWETGLEEQLTEVEVMKYDVGLLTDDNCVDVISMIRSIKNPDERIEIAIDEAMEDYSWYAE